MSKIADIAPTPWKGHYKEILNAHGSYLCDCYSRRVFGTDEGTYIRDHIIRCVNAHQKLLAMLREVADDLDAMQLPVTRAKVVAAMNAAKE